MIQCPVCLDNDQIRKVSSIVNSGRMYSGSDSFENSLASQLSYYPPWDLPGCLIYIGAIYACAAFGPELIRIITGVPIVFLFVLFLVIKYRRSILAVFASAFAFPLLLWASPYGIPTFLGGASLVAFVVLRKKYLRENREKHARERENWHQLYYCFRDDVVFHPGTGRYGPPETMELLTQEE